jgi:hypothetical protein
MPTIGGTIYVEIAGRQRAIEGEFTYDPGGFDREQSTDCNGEAVGHTKKIRNTSFDAVLYLIDGLTQADIEGIEDKPASISCPDSRHKARTDLLSCASCKDVNPSKGTAKATFFAPGRMF